jgi:nickel-dependent lactate racemase
MISVLRYGIGSSLSLDLPAGALVAHCAAPRGVPLVCLADALDRALAEPLAFPPLVQSAVPGDKVVLALDHDVPQAATLVARAVQALLSCGVAAEDIRLVRAPGDAESNLHNPLTELPANLRQAIHCEVHDPDHRGSLSYLGAAANAKPIYVNRAIHDADLVISMGCLRLSESLGYCGISAGIFPTFSDAASLARYRSPRVADASQRSKLRTLADEVGWLLGARFTIQVVPGCGADVLHVLGGESQAVFREGDRLCEEAWSFSVPRRAELVVATIEGEAGEQTWHNVGRALAAASHVVDEHGAVAICTDLAEAPGAGLQQIIGADDLDAVLGEIERTRPADALTAAELVRALERGKVYFVSRLDEDLVEDLGISPIAADQVSRLAGRYDSCIVLGNAQLARAQPRGERTQEPSIAERKSRR